MIKVKEVIRNLLVEEVKKRQDFKNTILFDICNVDDFNRYVESGLIYVLAENSFFLSFVFRDIDGLCNVIVSRTSIDCVAISSVLIDNDDIDKFVEMIQKNSMEDNKQE